MDPGAEGNHRPVDEIQGQQSSSHLGGYDRGAAEAGRRGRMTSSPATRQALSDKMEARFATASGVTDAVLYEGYILYPYHATHGKNRGGVRFQWGVLVPPSWRGGDPPPRALVRAQMIGDLRT